MYSRDPAMPWSSKAYFDGDPVTIKRREIGDTTSRYDDAMARRMNALRREVPSAFWLEPWEEFDVEAYYDVMSMTTVVFRRD